MGESDFNHFMRLKNQLLMAAETCGREQKFSPIQIRKSPKDRIDHLKLAHRVVDNVDCANWKICVTMFCHIVDKPESSYTQVRLLEGKKRERKFNEVCRWIINLKDLYIYLMQVLLYMIKLLLVNQFEISHKKQVPLFTLCHFSFHPSRDES